MKVIFDRTYTAFLLAIGLMLLGCNSEDANDCLQTSGATVRQEVAVSGFNRILVNRDVELIVSSGAEYQVTIETGRNLLNDVEAKVDGDQLILIDHNTCNFVRDFGITKVYVTAPNIREIRSSTQYDVSSDGVLDFETLRLISEDFNFPGSFTVGDFRLDVDTQNLRIASNLISSFYINGQTQNLYIGFFAGAGRFEGRNLVAQDIEVFHRGSNNMIINPQASLTGALFSTGDLVAINRPDAVSVEEFFTGRLIFED